VLIKREYVPVEGNRIVELDNVDLNRFDPIKAADGPGELPGLHADLELAGVCHPIFEFEFKSD